MAKTFNDLPASIQGIVLIAVGVVLAGVAFWYYVMPLNDQRDGLQKEVARLKAENDRNEAFRQQQTEYLNRIKQLESQLDTLRSIVPDDQATDEFMKTVFADGAGTSTFARRIEVVDRVTHQIREHLLKRSQDRRADGRS